MSDIELVIKIPEKEFGIDIDNKFHNFFSRLRAEIKAHCVDNISLVCGAYELETINMFLKAFANATPLPKGQWIRMSDLSEKEDNRYKCSRCGNVVHYKNKMDLYTFNSWCGRCGSDNGRKIEVDI